MHPWSLDILRQSAWDTWVGICLAASLALLAHLLFSRPWRRGAAGRLSLALAGIGIGGTLLVLLAPALHSPRAGFFWTISLLSLLAAVFYLNLLDRLSLRAIATLFSLRTAALIAAVPMLFEPGCRYLTRQPPRRPILFCIDTSGSMSVPDAPNGPTRIQAVWQALNPLLPAIRERLVPRFFTFSTVANELTDLALLAKLVADGKATDIAAALLKTLSATTREDAAIVLISDGNDNVSPDVAEAVRSSHHPIFTVRIGSEQAEPATLANIAVTDLEAPEELVVGQESPIRATIRSTALPDRVVDVRMAEVDADGRLLSQPVVKQLVLQPVVEGQTVALPFKPSTVGVHRLAVWVDPVAGERSVIDNRQELQALAIDPRIKVLYIEGRARPEFRDLKRMLARDPNVELATLLRIQKDRFAASGTVDAQVFHQMPRTPEEWKKFDVILLGDLDSSFLPPLQQTAIEQHTADGGGLMMIGGQNCFGPGGYKGSPIENALPVLVGDTSMPQEKEQFVPRLTSQGAVHPAMQGLMDYFGMDQKSPAKALPPLRGNVVVQEAKTGAQVLLFHPGRPAPNGKPQIVLATELYGRGRSAAFTIDTTYLWALPLYGLGQESPYNRVWGQLVRWLAGAKVRNRQRGAGIEGLLNKNVYLLGESVRLRALIRDERGDATRFAQVTAALSSPARPTRNLTLDPVDSHTGMYELVIAHPEKGDWSLHLAASKDGKDLGHQQLKFTVIPPAEEMLKIAANPALLKSIASSTGGAYYELRELPALIDEIIRSDSTNTGSREIFLPLYDFPRAALWLMGQNPNWPPTADLPVQGALVTILLCAEWTLRRRWDLH